MRRRDDRATDDEIQATALQFIRKVSGDRPPSRTNAESFEGAVDGVTESFRDVETASIWNPVTDWTNAGPFMGTRLTKLPMRRAFWLELSVAVLGIELDVP